MDRSTVSAAVREVRPLLAARSFAVPDRPGLRLRTVEDVFAYASGEGVDLRIDGTEAQVRRPRAGRPGRKAFVSGKKKQNTIKTTTFSDHQGRTLFSGVTRPGRMHDQTAVRTEGITEQFHRHPTVKAEADDGYRGLANEFPGQISAPPKKPAEDACDGNQRAWREAKRAPVLRPDLYRAHQRRAEEMAAAPAVHRTARHLHRNPPGDRRPRLRPLSQQTHTPPTQHRTGTRRTAGQLITHQPTRQASTP